MTMNISKWTNALTLIHILLLCTLTSSDSADSSHDHSWWADMEEEECTCDDRSFYVEYTSTYTRHDYTYGYDIYCYSYLITRSEDYNQHDHCTEEIDFVTLGVSTDECDHEVSDLQHIIVDYGASAQYNCTTSLLKDDTYNILGMRYECDFAPNNDVNIFLCTTIPDSIV